MGSATGLSSGQVTTLLKMPVVVKPLESKFGTAAQATQARVVANILIVLLYLLIILNSQLILTSVAEEKTSRIAELLIASVDPKALLAGKIAASASLAIVQLVVWVALGFAFGSTSAMTPGQMNSHGGSDGFSFTGISPADIGGFVIFFLLGFLQMATMFAASAR